MADWRGILRRGQVLARQMLRKILPGARPLELVPVEGGVAFRGPVAWASVLAGLANLNIVVPPEESADSHAEIAGVARPAA